MILLREQGRPTELKVGDLEISTASWSVAYAGQRTSLSAMQFKLLYELALAPERVFSFNELKSRLWDDGYETENINVVNLRKHITLLRKALRNIGASHFIINKWGFGWSLVRPGSTSEGWDIRMRSMTKYEQETHGILATDVAFLLEVNGEKLAYADDHGTITVLTDRTDLMDLFTMTLRAGEFFMERYL